MTENDFEISKLLIRRNCLKFEIEQLDELLNKIGEAKGLADVAQKAGAKTQSAAVDETTFQILKFEPQQGAKLGDYETADRKGNIPEKFQYALGVLSKSNATIQSRYHGQGYVYGYWLYGSDKIYRQKLKGAQP